MFGKNKNLLIGWLEGSDTVLTYGFIVWKQKWEKRKKIWFLDVYLF